MGASPTNGDGFNYDSDSIYHRRVGVVALIGHSSHHVRNRSIGKSECVSFFHLSPMFDEKWDRFGPHGWECVNDEVYLEAPRQTDERHRGYDG